MIDDDWRVRQAAFRFLEGLTLHHGEVLDWQTLTKGFHLGGTVVPLLGAAGIWKPAMLDLPISITTSPPKPGKPPPYADEVRDDGLLLYRYRGTDPQHPDNVRLRRCAAEQRPLIYFHGVQKGRYRPFWPAVIIEDDPAKLHVAVALYEGAAAGVDLATSGLADREPDRAYARRLTLQRLHQPAFRERVLRAYQETCTVCRLRHSELLDAAHIIPDTDPRGLPEVSNGLALCKIHHAAFDRHILGIRPDHVIEIRADVLEEVDGPMLRHGLQERHGQRILLPRRHTDRPNPDHLEERYEQFRAAS